MNSVARILIPLHLAVLPLAAQQDLLEQPSRWTTGAGAEFVRENGKPVLHLVGGASLDSIQFQDGSIAFDVRLSGYPGFVGLQFRAGERDAEHVYLRPHRSGEWDAIQYQPIMNGSSTWQLHRGQGYTAPVTLPHGEWLPVRIDVLGDRADLYVGTDPEPVMHMTLERGVTSGTLAFTSGFRGAAPDGAVPASFRHLVVSPSDPLGGGARERATPAADEFLRVWRVSAPVAVAELPITVIPPADGQPRDVIAEPRGLVNLNRYFSRIAGAGRSAVTASTVLRADQPMLIPMAFDFSDDISVFLNGTLIFSGANEWESRYPYYLGALHPDILTNQVWLPLVEGENTLSLVVSEQAFGWGFVATVDDRPGLHVAGR